MCQACIDRKRNPGLNPAPTDTSLLVDKFADDRRGYNQYKGWSSVRLETKDRPAPVLYIDNKPVAQFDSVPSRDFIEGYLMAKFNATQLKMQISEP